jgi:integrase
MFSKACQYIEYRKKLGFRVGIDGYFLKSFGKYADTRAPGKPLSVKVALEWATLPQTSKMYHTSRLRALRSFAKHLWADEPKTEIIPSNLLRSHMARRQPYIYSPDEIMRLMNVTTNSRPRSIENTTFSTIIGLLACTGMRIGEVLALNCCDIDLEKQVISVQWSKKLPVRYLPLSKTVVAKLQEYKRLRNDAFPGNSCARFFMNFEGKELKYSVFRGRWKWALKKTGIGSTSIARPRAHDFRHTFACNFLHQAYQKNMDMNVAVHLLSVYLGHSHIRDSYWYLTGVPDLMRLCCVRFENHIAANRKGDMS